MSVPVPATWQASPQVAAVPWTDRYWYCDGLGIEARDGSGFGEQFGLHRLKPGPCSDALKRHNGSLSTGTIGPTSTLL
ncbi:MAG: hypothetical protein ABIZ07_06300 [Dermatophilaceae bacterium]